MIPAAKKVIYFVRHGQSVDNPLPVYQAADSPLSETGRIQAKQLAERIKKIDFEALIASPLARAEQTATTIAEVTGKDVEFNKLFIECVMPSSIMGASKTDRKANEVWDTWQDSLFFNGERVEDAETYHDVTLRADRALEFLLNRPESSLVVITHGFFIRTMLAKVLIGDRLDQEIFQRIQLLASMENTAISVLLFKGTDEEHDSWRLWTYNDHAHFAE